MVWVWVMHCPSFANAAMHRRPWSAFAGEVGHRQSESTGLGLEGAHAARRWTGANDESGDEADNRDSKKVLTGRG